MLHKLMIGVLGALAGMFSTAALAQGTAVEAKAMLEKAVAAVKADKAKALDIFNKGEGGFLDRDLYVFCSNVSDGKLLADGNPNAKRLIGTDDKTLKDSTGKAFGQEQFAAGQKPEGQITEVSYLFPKPGPDKTPVPKISFVTRVLDIYCGVGTTSSPVRCGRSTRSPLSAQWSEPPRRESWRASNAVLPRRFAQ
jgi:hypothetical protein